MCLFHFAVRSEIEQSVPITWVVVTYQIAVFILGIDHCATLHGTHKDRQHVRIFISAGTLGKVASLPQFVAILVQREKGAKTTFGFFIWFLHSIRSLLYACRDLAYTSSAKYSLA